MYKKLLTLLVVLSMAVPLFSFPVTVSANYSVYGWSIYHSIPGSLDPEKKVEMSAEIARNLGNPGNAIMLSFEYNGGSDAPGEGGDADNLYLSMYSTVTGLTPGATYILAFDTKVQNTSWFNVHMNDWYVGVHGMPGEPNIRDWTRYEFEYTLPAGQTTMQPLFVLNRAANKNSPAIAYLDNISLVEKDGDGRNMINIGEFGSEADREYGVERRLTPIMGWSSWNSFGQNVNEAAVLAQADALKRTGLADVGFVYVNIDDTFQDGRDENGVLKVNDAKFPNGMQYIAEYCHDLGLRAGIYSDAGDNTCFSGANREQYAAWLREIDGGKGVGLYGYEEQDLRMYLDEWGYDFIKVDWCGGVNLSLDQQLQYTKISNIIRQISEDTGSWKIFNVCSWRFPGEWVVDIADSWRISGDVEPTWTHILKQIDDTASLAQYAGPGHVNDPDMMVVGNGYLTYDQNKSHFSMWCMLAAPLILGNDLRYVSDQTLSILKNEELIALNQDSAVIQASLLKSVGDGNQGQVWVKDLGEANSNEKAVAFLNRSDEPMTIDINWNADLGMQGNINVRDLWLHEDLPKSAGYTAELPAHGIVVLKVSKETGSFASDDVLQAVLSNAPATVNLDSEGSIDYIQLAAEASKADIIEYTNSTSETGNLGTVFSWSEGSSPAAVEAGNDFSISIPNGDGDQRARLYFGGSEGAYVKVQAQLGDKITTEYVVCDGSAKVWDVQFSSAGDQPITFTLEALTGTAYAAAVTLGTKTYHTVSEPVLETSLRCIDNETMAIENSGGLDWIVFDANKANTVNSRKSANGYLPSFVSSASSVPGLAGTNVTLTAAGNTIGSNVSTLRNEGDYFELVFPSTEALKKSDLYFSVRDAEVELAIFSGEDEKMNEKMYAAGEERSHVLSVWYCDENPIVVRLTLSKLLSSARSISIMGAGIQNEAYIVKPPVLAIDNGDLTAEAEISNYSGSADSVKMAAAMYTNEGILAYAGVGEPISISDYSSFGTFANQIPNWEASSTGVLKLFVWDDGDIQPLTNSFTYTLPLQEAKNDEALPDEPSFIGNLTAKARVADGAILVDARTVEEVADTASISGAVHCPADKMYYNFADIISDKDAEIIVYGENAAKSAQAVRILKYAGYTDVYDLGSMSNWDIVPTVILPENPTSQYMQANVKFDVIASPHDDISVYYSIGSDAVAYTDAEECTAAAGVTMDGADTLWVYLVYDGAIIDSSSKYYNVYTAEPLPTDIPDVFASELEFKNVEQSYDVPVPNESIGGNTITIAGNKFNYGIGAHASSSFEVDVPAGAKRFIAVAGIDDEEFMNVQDNRVKFEIYLDGELVGESFELVPQQYKVFDIDVTDGSVLRLVADETADGINNDHADWGIAGFVIEMDDLDIMAYASDMNWTDIDRLNEGNTDPDVSSDGNPLKIVGYQFDKGLGIHAHHTIKYDIPTGAKSFVAVAGIDDEVWDNPDYTGGTYVEFFIYIDDVPMGSALIQAGQMKVFKINIPDAASELTLVAEDYDGPAHDHANWGIAGFMANPFVYPNN